MSIAEIPQFFGVGKAQELTRLEQGHINETYIAICGGRKYVLQSLNEEVFHDPDAVMENIRRICAAFEQEGGDFRVPHFLTADGRNFVRCGGSVWRMYDFAEKCGGSDFLVGASFGTFIRVVQGIELADTIEDLHDLGAYLARLETLAPDCPELVRLKKLWRDIGGVFDDLPKRNVHGDAKADNVVTGESCTIIDLDTAMRGYAAIDYGDAVRSVMGANCDKSRIEEVKRGFLSGAGESLSQAETESLPYGVLYTVGELAARYLIDCYSENRYFRDKTLEQCRKRADELMTQLDKLGQ